MAAARAATTLRPGVLLDVLALNESGRGGRLNLDAVINPFRLSQ